GVIRDRSDIDQHSNIKSEELGEYLGDNFFLDARPALINRDHRGAIVNITPLDEIDGVDVYREGEEPEPAHRVPVSITHRDKTIDILANRLFEYYRTLPRDSGK